VHTGGGGGGSLKVRGLLLRNTWLILGKGGSHGFQLREYSSLIGGKSYRGLKWVS